METTFSFSKSKLLKIPLPEAGRVTYKDSEIKGLQLRVSYTGTKSFLIYKKLNGRPIRVTLGQFPSMTVEQARKNAQLEIAKMFNGIDPNQAKKAKRNRGITLSQCLNDYFIVHRNLAESTKQDYCSVVNNNLAEWLAKPLMEIKRNDVAAKFRSISIDKPPTANKAMRVLRALFNFAHGEYEDDMGNPLILDNPVTKISHNREWNKVERRQGVLRPNDIKPWWVAVDRMVEAEPAQHETAATLADYLRFVLCTGMRRMEAATLKWENVDLRNRCITVVKTKNKKPLTIPMTTYIEELLKKRKSTRVNEYVFEGRGAAHLKDPKKALDRIGDICGIRVTAHDLRRTFISVAESLDISPYVVKKLVNHSMGGDVTAGYIIWDVERLRAPMEKINEFILKQAGVVESAPVLNLTGKRKQTI